MDTMTRAARLRTNRRATTATVVLTSVAWLAVLSRFGTIALVGLLINLVAILWMQASPAPD